MTPLIALRVLPRHMDRLMACLRLPTCLLLIAQHPRSANPPPLVLVVVARTVANPPLRMSQQHHSCTSLAPPADHNDTNPSPQKKTRNFPLFVRSLQHQVSTSPSPPLLHLFGLLHSDTDKAFGTGLVVDLYEMRWCS